MFDVCAKVDGGRAKAPVGETGGNWKAEDAREKSKIFLDGSAGTASDTLFDDVGNARSLDLTKSSTSAVGSIDRAAASAWSVNFDNKKS